MDLGKRLRQMRLERNMTQQTIADAIQVELRTYQRYEEGSREPSLSMLVVLADILEVSVDYLLGRTDER